MLKRTFLYKVFSFSSNNVTKGPFTLVMQIRVEGCSCFCFLHTFCFYSSTFHRGGGGGQGWCTRLRHTEIGGKKQWKHEKNKEPPTVRNCHSLWSVYFSVKDTTFYTHRTGSQTLSSVTNSNVKSIWKRVLETASTRAIVGGSTRKLWPWPNTNTRYHPINDNKNEYEKGACNWQKMKWS